LSAGNGLYTWPFGPSSSHSMLVSAGGADCTLLAFGTEDGGAVDVLLDVLLVDEVDDEVEVVGVEVGSRNTPEAEVDEADEAAAVVEGGSAAVVEVEVEVEKAAGVVEEASAAGVVVVGGSAAAVEVDEEAAGVAEVDDAGAVVEVDEAAGVVDVVDEAIDEDDEEEVETSVEKVEVDTATVEEAGVEEGSALVVVGGGGVDTPLSW
jgi:hypothetical protein